MKYIKFPFDYKISWHLTSVFTPLIFFLLLSDMIPQKRTWAWKNRNTDLLQNQFLTTFNILNRNGRWIPNFVSRNKLILGILYIIILVDRYFNMSYVFIVKICTEQIVYFIFFQYLADLWNSIFILED